MYFELLREMARDGPGVTREAFGPGEELAFDFVRRLAGSLGLRTAIDAVGNLSARLHGTADAPAIVVGSHIDSVPRGGNYDGAAGIAAGLLVLARLARQPRAGAVPIELLVLRCEESPWFNRPYIGSLALFGRLAARDLARPRATASVHPAAPARLPRARRRGHRADRGR